MQQRGTVFNYGAEKLATFVAISFMLIFALSVSGCASKTGRIAENGKIVPTDTNLASDGYPKSWGQPINVFHALNVVSIYQVIKIYSEEEAKKTELYSVLSKTLSPEQLSERGTIVRITEFFSTSVSDDMIPSGGPIYWNLHWDAYVVNPELREKLALGDVVGVLLMERYGSKLGIGTLNPVGNMLRVAQILEKNTKGYGRVVRDMDCAASFLNSAILPNSDCLKRIDTNLARKWAIESWNIEPQK